MMIQKMKKIKVDLHQLDLIHHLKIKRKKPKIMMNRLQIVENLQLDQVDIKRKGNK